MIRARAILVVCGLAFSSCIITKKMTDDCIQNIEYISSKIERLESFTNERCQLYQVKYSTYNLSDSDYNEMRDSMLELKSYPLSRNQAIRHLFSEEVSKCFGSNPVPNHYYPTVPRPIRYQQCKYSKNDINKFFGEESSSGISNGEKLLFYYFVGDSDSCPDNSVPEYNRYDICLPLIFVFGTNDSLRYVNSNHFSLNSI